MHSAAELASGRQMGGLRAGISGDELSGWDYAFNSFDVATSLIGGTSALLRGAGQGTKAALWGTRLAHAGRVMGGAELATGMAQGFSQGSYGGAVLNGLLLALDIRGAAVARRAQLDELSAVSRRGPPGATAHLYAPIHRRVEYTTPSAKADIRRANRRIFKEFKEHKGKIILYRNYELFDRDMRVFGEYAPKENRIYLYAGSNRKTLSHELIHFDQILQLGKEEPQWGVFKGFPPRRAERFERDVRIQLRRWGYAGE